MKKHQTRFGIAATGLALVGAVLAGCSNSGSDSGSSSKIEVGFTTGLSGPYGAYGASLQDGFRAGIDEINAGGGIDGRKLKVSYLDDASAPDRGSSNYTQLAGRSVVVSGEVLSNVCDAIAPVAAQKGTPMFCMNSGPSTINPPQKNMFVAFVQSADWSRPSFDFATSVVDAPAPRAAVINMSLAGSASYGDAVAGIAKSEGWDVDRVQLDPADPNPGTALDKALKNKPDVILANMSDTAAIQLAQSLKNAGASTPVIMSGGGLSYKSISTIASPNFYVLTPYLFVNTEATDAPKGVTAFADAVKRVDGDVHGTYTAAGYLQAILIGQALKDCGGDCKPADLAAQLSKTTIKTDGVTSSEEAGFSAKSHQAVSSLSVYVWDSAANAMKLADSGLEVGSK